ncbi:MAG TPA: hypothetical protein VF746_07700 [Longimicrobium sp.]
MSRTTIQEFRARLAGRAEENALLRAYRSLAQRPTLAAGMQQYQWAEWPEPGVPAAVRT